MLLLGLIEVPTWLLLVIGLLVLLYWYTTKDFNFFSSQGVPGPKPYPFIGTAYQFFKPGLRLAFYDNREKYGKKYGKFISGTKHLTVSDPEILNQVLVKDFDNFTDRSVVNNFPDKIQANLLTQLSGDEWKRVRNLLTPTFTTGKLKAMVGHINHCCAQLVEKVDEEAQKDETFEVKKLCGAFTMDTIARTAFGFELNAQQDEDNIFIRMAKKAMNPSKLLLIVVFLLMPVMKLTNRLKISLLPTEALHFFSDIVEKVVEGRRKGGEQPDDFIKLMMTAHEDAIDTAAVKEEVADGGAVFDEEMASKRKGLTKDELLAQGVLFFLAGYDTTSKSLIMLLYCLAMNQECQDKVYAQIMEVMGEKEVVDYDAVSKLTYLDMCLAESLRMHTVAPVLGRAVKKDCVLDGVKMPADSMILIPSDAIHYDPEIFPEPHKYRPDRFTPEEKAKRPPVFWLPFGYGPRNCIGMRLAQLELKMAVTHLVRKYRLLPCEETPVDFKFNTMGQLVDCFLKVETRTYT